MQVKIISGDLLQQDVDVIVNPWNQNIIPWWLLRPHGVSGAIKRRAGIAPFQEVARFGKLSLGQAILTTAGELPYKGIIHVAAITSWGRSNKEIIKACVKNAIKIVVEHNFFAVAFPALGCGSGRMQEETVIPLIEETLWKIDCDGDAIIIRSPSRQRKM